MSGKQKVILILVAVVLVVLFVIAIGGRDPGQGNPNAHNPFLEWLSKLGGKQAAVPTELVHAPCMQPDHRTLRIPANSTCTLQVDDPKSLKLLVLRSPRSFGVRAPAPGKADFTTTDTIKLDDTGVAKAKVAIDKPSDVEVTCTGPTLCTLTIGEE
jgi:hypothetical protein